MVSRFYLRVPEHTGYGSLSQHKEGGFHRSGKTKQLKSVKISGNHDQLKLYICSGFHVTIVYVCVVRDCSAKSFSVCVCPAFTSYFMKYISEHVPSRTC